MKPKVGQSFWSAICIEGRVLISEWVVSSIVNECILKPIPGIPKSGIYRYKANLIRKDNTTWVKKSPKSGDYGWSKNIRRMDRSRIYLEDDKSFNIRKKSFKSSIVSALKHLEGEVLRRIKSGYECFEFDGEMITEEMQIYEDKKSLSAVRRAITREVKSGR